MEQERRKVLDCVCEKETDVNDDGKQRGVGFGRVPPPARPHPRRDEEATPL